MNKDKSVASLFSLLSIFAKIGAFTLGGGYAMIPLIENEVVKKRHYIEEEEFLDLLAIAQSAPGVLAANVAIYIGYKMRGVWGSIFATLGAILPSFFIILFIAIFFQNFREEAFIEAIFKGIRPCVVALIAVPTFSMARRIHLNWMNIWIPIIGAFSIWILRVSPIYIIILAGLGGLVYGWIERKLK